MSVSAAESSDGLSSSSSDNRREQMLEAALDVIAERGFPETRIADVAARAGTSPALVIYYFKTRDQLLTEAIRLSEDRWYAEGMARLEALPTAAAKLEELVAMSCLTDESQDDPVSWVIWLDLWAQSARHAEVAAVRKEFDDHWLRTLVDLVKEGQRNKEFQPVDADDFGSTLSALLDGFAIQIALDDDSIADDRAFKLAMTYAASTLGFEWSARKRRTARRRTGSR